MPRAVNGTVKHKRTKKVLKQAKGFQGRASTNYRVARESVMRKLQFAYRDRRNKKRDFRRLWIIRINAGVREVDPNFSYSLFISGLRKANIEINRKFLSNMAIEDKEAFAALVEKAKAAL